MEYKVSLGDNRFVSIHDCLIANEKNILVFDSNMYGIGKKLCVTVAKNGHEEKPILLQDNFFDISPYCKRACRIDIKVELIINGQTAKTWVLEPIVVRELDGKIEAIPEFIEMRREIAMLRQCIRELNTKIYETM
jgi:hypothetical protein